MSHSNRQLPTLSVSSFGTPVSPQSQLKLPVFASDHPWLMVTVQFGQENVKHLYFRVPKEITWQTFTENYLGICWRSYVEDHGIFHGWRAPENVEPHNTNELIPTPNDPVDPEVVINALLDRYSSLWEKDKAKPLTQVDEVSS